MFSLNVAWGSAWLVSRSCILGKLYHWKIERHKVKAQVSSVKVELWQCWRPKDNGVKVIPLASMFCALGSEHKCVDINFSNTR